MQNGAAESTINSIMLVGRTVIVESCLGNWFWFRATTAGKEASHVTFKERVEMRQHQSMYGEKKNVSVYWAFGFGCRAYVYQDKLRWENGRQMEEAVFVGFVPNMSAWAFWIPVDKKIMESNQVKFDEHEFPYQTRRIVEQHLSDNPKDILS